MNLTNRTKIEFRYTTHPADMGYDGRPTEWLTLSPVATGTPRTILARANEALRHLISGGTYYRAEFRLARTQEPIAREEIEFFVGLTH
jgi:hypothetical protein